MSRSARTSSRLKAAVDCRRRTSATARAAGQGSAARTEIVHGIEWASGGYWAAARASPISGTALPTASVTLARPAKALQVALAKGIALAIAIPVPRTDVSAPAAGRIGTPSPRAAPAARRIASRTPTRTPDRRNIGTTYASRPARNAAMPALTATWTRIPARRGPAPDARTNPPTISGATTTRAAILSGTPRRFIPWSDRTRFWGNGVASSRGVVTVALAGRRGIVLAGLARDTGAAGRGGTSFPRSGFGRSSALAAGFDALVPLAGSGG